MVRALEVVLLTGSMPGRMTSYEMHLPTTYVGVDRPDLPERIAQRVTQMWEHGLVAEVAALEGLREGVTASRALGYCQALLQLDGVLDEATAQVQTVAATRRFARRQRSWFRRDPRVSWLPGDHDLLAEALAVLRRSG